MELEAEQLGKMLGPPVDVGDEVLRGCGDRVTFTALAFELYKEVGKVLAVCTHTYDDGGSGKGKLLRDQAMCAGLLVRISKFMISVLQLSEKGDRGDVILALNRCIVESAVNLLFLAERNEKRYFDEFVEFSLGPEREFYDQILRNIKARGGTTLPIEERMLRSIDRICKLSGMRIEDIKTRYPNWGGNLRDRLKALGWEDAYVGIQRIASHAIHGTWVDLMQHHLEEEGETFTPDPSWLKVDPRLLCPPATVVLDATQTYLKRFFGEGPGLRALYERIVGLRERIQRVDAAHEEWFGTRRQRQS